MQPSVTNAKIGWLPRKVKGCVRTALNQANPGLLLINVPKRLSRGGEGFLTSPGMRDPPGLIERRM